MGQPTASQNLPSVFGCGAADGMECAVGLAEACTSNVAAKWLGKLVKSSEWLGQPPMSAPSPQGWPDTAADWSAPEQVLRRVELAEQYGSWLARDAARMEDPEIWARDILGPALDDDVAKRVRRAPDRATAFALVLASPAFQWR